MTIKELYDWAVANDCVNCNIETYDCDGGMYLSDTHDIGDSPEKVVYPSGYTAVIL